MIKMVNQNFIIASVFAAIISTIVIKIFTPEITGIAENIRNAKPKPIMEVPKV